MGIIYYMISMITNCELELDGKNPHFTKLQISQWSTVDRRRCGNARANEPNEILTRWWSSIYRYETAFCHKKNSWWPGIGSWVASFRIPIIFITREGLFVKILTGLYCILTGLAPDILKMEFWTHMGCTANIIIKDIIHIFASMCKNMRILVMGRRYPEHWLSNILTIDTR